MKKKHFLLYFILLMANAFTQEISEWRTEMDYCYSATLATKKTRNKKRNCDLKDPENQAKKNHTNATPTSTPQLSIWTKDDPALKMYDIGDWSYGNPRVLDWGGVAKLKIGKFCAISQNVTIALNAEHRTDWVSTYTFGGIWPEMFHHGHPGTKGDVIIGNDVWIAFGATILSGVTIGNGAVIGAGAMVTKDVPSFAIVAGNPAQIKGYRFSQEVIQKLEQIKWWDWPLATIKPIVPFLTSQPTEEFFIYAEYVSRELNR